MSKLNRREAIGAVAAVALVPGQGEGIEQRAYRELVEYGIPESDAAKFARESVQPGGVLRNARLALGLTPGELAAKAEIGRSCLRVLELEGQNDVPDFQEGMRLCRTLDITVDSLFAELRQV